ncbi:unnamed protein product [Miscanthus lutarioriparius]|uniref:Uncharacterized protein n=1 Tax=Miscanthus lutarioriparius TaxID=422564 RepID=A0A811R8B5_9POAL|nr:unnamed protein product [Miscanthus lutarioriparius]
MCARLCSLAGCRGCSPASPRPPTVACPRPPAAAVARSQVGRRALARRLPRLPARVAALARRPSRPRALAHRPDAACPRQPDAASAGPPCSRELARRLPRLIARVAALARRARSPVTAAARPRLRARFPAARQRRCAGPPDAACPRPPDDDARDYAHGGWRPAEAHLPSALGVRDTAVRQRPGSSMMTGAITRPSMVRWRLAEAPQLCGRRPCMLLHGEHELTPGG